MKQEKAKGSSREIAILSQSQVRNLAKTQRRVSEILDIPAFKQIAETQRRASEILDIPAFKQIAEAQRRASEILDIPTFRQITEAQRRASEILDIPAFKQIAEAQRRASEILDIPAFKQIAEAQRKVSEILDIPAFKQIAEAQRRASEILDVSAFKQMVETHRRISNLISKELVFDNWVKTNIQLFDHVNRRIFVADLIDSEILPTLENYNWFLTVSLKDSFISDLSKVINNSSDKLPTAIRQEFISYFSNNNFKNLQIMVMGWEGNPLFKPRMKIFKDSFKLLKHSHNSYNPANVLIPTLISQIDGILTDYLIQNQFKFVKINKQWAWQDKNLKNNYGREKVYKSIFDSTSQNYSLTNGEVTETSLEIGSDFILNTLFQTAYTRQELKKPFGLSRHKIMHGENITYGRKDHLFRTFLILDFLYGLKNIEY